MPPFDRRAVVLGCALLLLGCAGDSDPDPRRGDEAASPPSAQLPRSLQLPDTLLLQLPAGDQIWWTIARESADSAGGTCVERGLEVRRDEARVAVPLLYSGDVPQIVDDTTIQVPLWTDCVPGRVYRVNVRTGQPTPLPAPGGQR